MLLYQILLYQNYTCKNIKMSYKNNKFKISSPTQNPEFELPSVSDIEDYFQCIVKNLKKRLIILQEEYM